MKNLVIFGENLKDLPHATNKFISWVIFEKMVIENLQVVYVS